MSGVKVLCLLRGGIRSGRSSGNSSSDDSLSEESRPVYSVTSLSATENFLFLHRRDIFVPTGITIFNASFNTPGEKPHLFCTMNVSWSGNTKLSTSPVHGAGEKGFVVVCTTAEG